MIGQGAMRGLRPTSFRRRRIGAGRISLMGAHASVDWFAGAAAAYRGGNSSR
jgi:hypothetical protein